MARRGLSGHCALANRLLKVPSQSGRGPVAARAAVIHFGRAIRRTLYRVSSADAGRGRYCQLTRGPDCGRLKTAVYGRGNPATTSMHLYRRRTFLSTTVSAGGGAAGPFVPTGLLVSGGIAGRGHSPATTIFFSSRCVLRSLEIVSSIFRRTSFRTVPQFALLA